MTITRIISGGQTGADRGGLDAAIALGLPHGGWCPRGRRAEDGQIPRRYQLVEHQSAEYPPRTYANVEAGDGTAIFIAGSKLASWELTGGSKLTQDFCAQLRRPVLIIDVERPVHECAAQLRQWVEHYGIQCLNVAGPRESRVPGIQARVAEIMWAALGGPIDSTSEIL